MYTQYVYQVVSECGNVVIEAKDRMAFYEKCKEYLIGVYSKWITEHIYNEDGIGLLDDSRDLMKILESTDLVDIKKYLNGLGHKIYVMDRKEI